LTDYARKFESHAKPKNGNGNGVETAKWFAKSLQYNVPNGKKNRGVALVLAYKMLMSKQGELTEENLRLAQILGWCVEMVSLIKWFS